MKYGHLFATRREMLARCGMGMGAAALQALLSDSGDLQAAPIGGEVNPLAPKSPPLPAKAKRTSPASTCSAIGTR